jgi:hypothetical protein
LQSIKPGTYRHYKGGIYRVILIARNPESLEEQVIYEGLTGTWVRPMESFASQVEVDGDLVPRFERLDND